MTINEYCQKCIWNCNRYAPGDEIMCMFPKCVKYIKKATIIDKIDLSEGSLEIGEDLIRKNFARKELLYEETPDVRI